MTRALLGILPASAAALGVWAVLLYRDHRNRAAAEMLRLHRDEMRREMAWAHRLPLDQEAARWLAAMDRELFGEQPRTIWGQP